MATGPGRAMPRARPSAACRSRRRGLDGLAGVGLHPGAAVQHARDGRGGERSAASARSSGEDAERLPCRSSMCSYGQEHLLQVLQGPCMLVVVTNNGVTALFLGTTQPPRRPLLSCTVMKCHETGLATRWASVGVIQGSGTGAAPTKENNHMRKSIVSVLAAGAALELAACGGVPAAPPPPRQPPHVGRHLRVRCPGRRLADHSGRRDPHRRLQGGYEDFPSRPPASPSTSGRSRPATSRPTSWPRP